MTKPALPPSYYESDGLPREQDTYGRYLPSTRAKDQAWAERFRKPQAEKFDPSQPRDERGKWSQTAGQIGNRPVDMSAEAWQDHIKKIADAHAKDMGFDPNKVHVVQGVVDFEVGDHKFVKGGHADPRDGSVTLFSDALSSDGIGEIMAHEVMHQRYNAFNVALSAEKLGLDAATKDLPVNDYMRADGLLKGEWATRFPLYQADAKIQAEGWTKMREADGVSDYSRAYWEGWHKGEVQTVNAVHETLAEMARHNYLDGGPPGHTRVTDRIITARPWSDYYKLVHKYGKLK